LEISIEDPLPSRVTALDDLVDGLDRVMTSPARPEPVTSGLEPGLPFRLQRVTHHSLPGAITDHGDAEGTQFPVRLRDEHPSHRPGPLQRPLDLSDQAFLVRRRQGDPPVNAGGETASIALCHLPHADQRVRPAPEHQLLQAADPLVVPGLRCREDPLPQPPYPVLGRPPVHGVPTQIRALRSVRYPGSPHPGHGRDGPPAALPYRGGEAVTRHASNLPFGSGALPLSPRRPTWPTSAPFRVRAAARIRPVIQDSRRRSRPCRPGFLLPFGHRRWLLGPSCPAEDFRLPHGRPTSHRLDLDGVSTFRTHETRSGRVPSLPRGGGAHLAGKECPGQHPPLPSGQP
jgi:hypothetical protein